VEFCVTLNCSQEIAPETVIRQMIYHHPVYTAAGFAAQKRWPEINGVNRTYFCGAYWGYGFHEDGVNSALAVGRLLGATL
jgi:predicted NAD/FAD-binding protein